MAHLHIVYQQLYDIPSITTNLKFLPQSRSDFKYPCFY